MSCQRVGEPHHTATPGVAELLTAILSWVAAQERERIRERIKAGLDRAKRHGTKDGPAERRPRIAVSRERARSAVQGLGSIRRAARHLGVSDRLLRQLLR